MTIVLICFSKLFKQTVQAVVIQDSCFGELACIEEHQAIGPGPVVISPIRKE